MRLMLQQIVSKLMTLLRLFILLAIYKVCSYTDQLQADQNLLPLANSPNKPRTKHEVSFFLIMRLNILAFFFPGKKRKKADTSEVLEKLVKLEEEATKREEQ